MEWLFEVIKQILFYNPLHIQGLVLADPVTALALATVGSAGIGYLGNKSSANTAAGASNTASQYGLQGVREGLQQQRDIYNTDVQNQYQAGQYLRNLLPNFDMKTIDPNSYFGEGNVNNYYNLAKTGLNQQYQQDLGNAQMGAGEQAASRGLLNPSLLTRSATNQVQQNYLPLFTGLETNRAGALLQNNKDLFQAMLGNQQYMNMLRQMGYGNQFQLASQFGNPNQPPRTLG